jgi:serine protease Do
MNRIISLALLALLVTGIARAQQKDKQRQEEELIIKKKGEKEEKTTIIIDGDRITINGKPITEYDGDNIIIRKKSLENAMAQIGPRIRMTMPGQGFDHEFNMNNFNFQFDEEWREDFEREMKKASSPRALLGVSTEKADKGLKVLEVSEGSAAEKAGLKPGDVLTKFAGQAVTEPQQLAELVRARKPEEEVEIAYIKAGEKKERKQKVKLGKTERFTFVPSEGPRAPRPPRPPMPPHEGDMIFVPGAPMPPMAPGMQDRQFFLYDNDRPQLGIRIQDLEDETGVKVIDVNDGSLAATAGIREDDVIVNIDGKRVKNTDEAREALQGAREKNTYPIVLNRGGSALTVEVKVPKKLKKADL